MISFSQRASFVRSEEYNGVSMRITCVGYYLKGREDTGNITALEMTSGSVEEEGIYLFLQI